VKYCHNCKTPWEGSSQPGVRATCQHCDADLHACLNCRFYDTFKACQCQINNIDPVLNKERSNFCDEFQFSEKNVKNGETKNGNETDKARDLWKNIFRDKK
jgi:hypothetical protein